PGRLLTSGAPHLPDVPRHAGAGGVAQPLEGPLVARRPIDLDVAAAPVAYHRLDGALVPHHTLVLRAPHRLEQGEMDEAQVIAVAVVLGEHLPVGGTAMPDPARGELDLALRREIAGAVDEPRGRDQEQLGAEDVAR